MKKNEKLFLDNIEKNLIKCGCKTWREVIPDICIGWEYPYRVDLIFYREDIGYIGAEGKDLHTLGSGTTIANAVNQIQNKYRPQTYFDGVKINRWCVVVPTEAEYIDKQSILIISRFVQNFLATMYGISFMTAKNKNKIYIDYGTKNSIIFKTKDCKNGC